MQYLIAVSGLGMLLIGILFIVFFKRRKPSASFKIISFGALTWFGAVILKFAWAVPLNRHVQGLLSRFLIPEIANPLFWIYVGLLTGVFECGAIYLLFKFSRLKEVSLDDAYGFGYGFGSIEAIILGLAQLLSCIAMATGRIPTVEVSRLVLAAPVVERTMAIFLHLYTTLLIIYSIKESKPYLFWLSFFYKSFVDTIAAWAQLSYGIHTASHLWTVEAIIFVVTLPSILGSVHFLRRRNPSPQRTQRISELPWSTTKP